VLISDPSVEEGFLRAVEALDEVQECHTITGDFSYLLKIRARDAKSFEQFLRERIKILPGVLRSHSLIALTTSKETSRIPLPG
jgi:Lrp/AsnC family leucine-responsive transcriptional regulator